MPPSPALESGWEGRPRHPGASRGWGWHWTVVTAGRAGGGLPHIWGPQPQFTVYCMASAVPPSGVPPVSTLPTSGEGFSDVLQEAT